jgi:hypothetical protein
MAALEAEFDKYVNRFNKIIAVKGVAAVSANSFLPMPPHVDFEMPSIPCKTVDEFSELNRKLETSSYMKQMVSFFFHLKCKLKRKTLRFVLGSTY